MAMTNRQNHKNDCFIFLTIEDLVPQNHLVRKLEAAIDFSFIYPKVEHLYSKVGRPSIDPVVLFKLLILNIVYGINSMRKTCERAQTDMAFRWFLGVNAYETIPNYSTWSQNYIRRYSDSKIFGEIFDEIISQAIQKHFVDLTTVFGDGTHQKANANKRKYHKEQVEICKKKYEDDLLKEINLDRECIGKKTYDSIEREEIIFDEQTGEEKVVKEQKTICVSDTDSECGCFHKGEKERCFAYEHQAFCDKNGFVLVLKTNPGNVHDSVAFYSAYRELNKKYPGQITNICLDSAYNNAPICREIEMNNQQAYMPYKRPMTKKGYMKKYEYVYDEQYDVYICPNNKLLTYTTTTRDGYREYVSDPSECKCCPYRNECTKSKNMKKVILRHIWEEYRENVDERRYTKKWKEIYPERKETIERVFADCKENFGLRFTRLKGLKKNQQQGLMIFACHNLKKMALWNWK
ncbi:MAG: IS1182 family transposase [Longicatena sp.]|nr:IS1182 family transposase [Longicatena sp.]